VPRPLLAYLSAVETFNYGLGRVAMYALFALMGVLLWGAAARAGGMPQVWTDEMGQFLLVGYFTIGGAYSLQLGSAVRMDVLYGAWSDRTKAAVDCLTIFLLVFYLGVLLWGGIESTQYALEFGERRRGLWAPPMAPIKIVMVIGILMMILQCSAFLLRDIARLRGIDLPPAPGDPAREGENEGAPARREP
jgi:TRAP-type mannitol/chloroaromatic compound transport system permease small subunit